MQSVNLPNGFWCQFSDLSHVGCVCSLFIGSVVAWQAEDPNIEAQHKAKQHQNKSCSVDGSHDSRQKTGDLLLFVTSVFVSYQLLGPGCVTRRFGLCLPDPRTALCLEPRVGQMT